jgi:hypothetical protein
MRQITAEQKIYFTLRLATAMCFIGHGAFGVITKQIWCNYFAVFGIGEHLAYQLMPPLGIVDIVMGLCILFYPVRGLFIWLVIWGAITAFLRPLSGEPLAEVFERAGNYGAPLAMLALTSQTIFSSKGLLQPVTPYIAHDADRMKRVQWILRIVVFFLIAGHGWLNLLQKQALLDQYTYLGFSHPAYVAKTIGTLEVLAAFSVLIKPWAPFILILFAWKMFSESFYLHYGVFEWIERGGSYGSILALWFMMSSRFSLPDFISRRKRMATGTTLFV